MMLGFVLFVLVFNTLIFLSLYLIKIIFKYLYKAIKKILIKILFNPYILASLPLNSPILQEVYINRISPFTGQITNYMEFSVRATVIRSEDPWDQRDIVVSQIRLESDNVSDSSYRLLESVKVIAEQACLSDVGYDEGSTESGLELMDAILYEMESYVTEAELIANDSNAISARDITADQWNLLNVHYESFKDFAEECNFDTNSINIVDWISNMAINDPALYAAHVIISGIDPANLSLP